MCIKGMVPFGRFSTALALALHGPALESGNHELAGTDMKPLDFRRFFSLH